MTEPTRRYWSDVVLALVLGAFVGGLVCTVVIATMTRDLRRSYCAPICAPLPVWGISLDGSECTCGETLTVHRDGGRP